MHDAAIFGAVLGKNVTLVMCCLSIPTFKYQVKVTLKMIKLTYFQDQ